VPAGIVDGNPAQAEAQKAIGANSGLVLGNDHSGSVPLTLPIWRGCYTLTGSPWPL
jgi:hypothetical protein